MNQDLGLLLQRYTENSKLEVSIFDFIFHLALAAILSYLVSKIYTRYSSSLSNRKTFASNLVIVSLTTMLIITIVKSSLALSLGLVGALSIVRFRTAIKEPEELSYLFMAIAIGLGMGAGQAKITTVAIVLISLFIYVRSFKKRLEEQSNFYLTFMNQNPDKLDLNKVVEILRKHTTTLDLKRLDQSKQELAASFMVNMENYASFETLKKEILLLDDSARLTFLDQHGV